MEGMGDIASEKMEEKKKEGKRGGRSLSLPFKPIYFVTILRSRLLADWRKGRGETNSSTLIRLLSLCTGCVSPSVGG